MQKLYVIRGNHDGNIGIATNFKSAFNIGMNYGNLKSTDAKYYAEKDDVPVTYSRAQSYCSKYSMVQISNNDDISITIEMFFANQH